MTTAVAFVYGAGLDQVPAIHEAHDLGIFVIACGADAALPAMRAADEFLVVDLYDPAAVVAALRPYSPDVILPAPYGPYVLTAGALIDAFGIAGAGRAASELCHDKRAFHEILASVGLPAPRQSVASSGRQIRAAIRRVGFPCIVKPRDGVGSRAVRVIWSAVDVARSVSWHLAERHTYGHTESVIEQFVDGTEYGINLVAADGETVFAHIHTKEMSPLPLRQEFGKFVDPATDSGTLAAIEDAVTRVVRQLGLRTCVINADVIVTPDGQVVILDFTPRMGGPMLAPALIPAASGVNITRETLRLFTGQDADFNRRAKNAVVLRFYPGVESGLVVTDPDVSRALETPGVVHLHCPLRAGMRLAGRTSTTELRSRALVVTAGATLADAEVAWLDATTALGLRVEDDLLTADLMEAMALSSVDRFGKDDSAMINGAGAASHGGKRGRRLARRR